MEIRGDQGISRSCIITHLRATEKEIALTKAIPNRVLILIDALSLVAIEEKDEKDMERNSPPLTK